MSTEALLNVEDGPATLLCQVVVTAWLKAVSVHVSGKFCLVDLAGRR